MLAGALILPVYLWERRSEWPRAGPGRTASSLLALGLFGVTLNQLLFVFGLSRTSVAHAAIFANLTPITGAAAGLPRAAWSKSRRGKLGGMAVALGGVAAAESASSRARRNARHVPGGRPAHFLPARFAFALFTVLGKPVTERHSTITVNAFAYVAAARSCWPP